MKYAPILILILILNQSLCQVGYDDFEGIVNYFGYSVESHVVTTEDGYILQLFRIPYGREEQEGTRDRTPLFVTHGLLMDANANVINGPDGSFPLYLADQGYDIWLINLRGTYYSRGHTTLSSSNMQYWDFDLTDMTQDIIDSIAYIQEQTGRDRITIIGFSNGSAIVTIAWASNPEWWTENVNVFIGLSPISRINNLTNRFFLSLLDPGTLGLLTTFGFNEVLTRNQVNNIMYDSLWLVLPWFWNYLSTELFHVIEDVDSRTAFDNLMHHTPAGINLSTLRQYSEMRQNGLFQYRQEGTNEIVEIPLQNIEIPVHFLAGEYDDYAVPEDVEWLASQIPNVVSLSWYPYDHISWLISQEAEYLPELLTIIQDNNE
jgi:pimeloyl-ACP methyl ester carboxylesterase